MLIAGLIDHPEMGLVLFETGSAEDVQRVGATDSVPVRYIYSARILFYSNGVQMQ